MKALIASALLLGTFPLRAQPIPQSLPPESLPDPADLISWPVKPYPESAPGSVTDVGSWLFDAPAGKRGFVRARPDGQLEFEDGTPARFWGTTTTYALTFPDKPEEIEKLANSIAAAGYNMVRFHHNDNNTRGLGFLQSDPKSNWKLDPKDMDRLDRFAAELYKRGIYVYLDLVDYRELLEEDGIPDWEAIRQLDNRGWKGLFPHPDIVAAWKRSVTELLSHVNPYTGRAWGREPGVVTIEIHNENGPFWDWNFKITEPMHKWHDARWNSWLVDKYGTRERLDAQWTDRDGRKGLFPDEDPAKGTVFAPRLAPLLDWDRPYRSKTRGAARVNDWYAYLADTAAGFYREASQHIRDLGFKGVIVGSHELQGPINQHAEVLGTGAIAAHLYASGGNTAWKARPGTGGITLEGVDVSTNNWFSNIPRIKVRGAPGINGEWTGSTLTRRADVNVAVAAATAFQKVTQSLHFGYGQRWVGVRLRDYDVTYAFVQHLGRISHGWSSMHDAPWMAVNRVIAPLFIEGGFKPARTKVHLAYSKVDLHEQNLHALGLSGGGGTIGDAAHFLPLLHEVESVFFNEAYEGDADVVFMTGRSASGDYRKAKHAVLIGDNSYADPWHKKRDIGIPARAVRPEVKITPLETPATFTLGAPWDDKRTLSFDKLEGVVEVATLPKGALPIGVSADGKFALGWLDDRYLVLPSGRAFHEKINDARWLYRLYLFAARHWGVATGDNSADSTAYRSDTGELTVDWAFGTTVIDTPRVQGFSGFIGWRPENRTSALTATIDEPYGNILAASADRKPLDESRRILLVATARIQNTGMELGRNRDGATAYTSAGKGPSSVEALRGRVTLASRHAADLSVHALDHTGRRLGRVDAEAKDGHLSFELSPRWGAIWFEIAGHEVDGPAAAFADRSWPLEEKPRAAAPPPPSLIEAGDFFKRLNSRARAESSASPASGEASGATPRVPLKDFAEDKFIGSFANIKAAFEQDADKGRVVFAQFGLVTQAWAGGVFFNIDPPPAGLRPGDVQALVIAFKGDGTLPRDTFINLTADDGRKWRTKNVNHIFENDAWHEARFVPSDFEIEPDFAKKNPERAKAMTAEPDWSGINRIDIVCVGPLINQKSTAHIGPVHLLLTPHAAAAAQSAALTTEAFRSRLPEAVPPGQVKVTIPFDANAKITADGKWDEAAWERALGIAMDEDNVPGWHFFGSHVVGGDRLHKEGARFWLLATPAGLALTTEIGTGRDEVVTESPKWFEGDCVEVFADVKNTGGKPDKQLFLAYRRPGRDRPAASDPSIQIGRAALAGGYILETLIPWPALGFDGVPEGEFGLEFQIDYAERGKGRVLQMTLGTGTNEAWIKSAHYLKAKIAK